jgi:exonuclease III
MSGPRCFIWNVHGLNDRACRGVVREFVLQERPVLVCLQETKFDVVCASLANETLGSDFDYVFLSAVGTAGGVFLGWHRGCMFVSDVAMGRHSLFTKVALETESGVTF